MASADGDLKELRELREKVMQAISTFISSNQHIDDIIKELERKQIKSAIAGIVGVSFFVGLVIVKEFFASCVSISDKAIITSAQVVAGEIRTNAQTCLQGEGLNPLLTDASKAVENCKSVDKEVREQYQKLGQRLHEHGTSDLDIDLHVEAKKRNLDSYINAIREVLEKIMIWPEGFEAKVNDDVIVTLLLCFSEMAKKKSLSGIICIIVLFVVLLVIVLLSCKKLWEPSSDAEEVRQLSTQLKGEQNELEKLFDAVNDKIGPDEL